MAEKTYSKEKLDEFKSIIEPELSETEKRINDLQQIRKKRNDHFAEANVDFNETSQHFQQQSKNKASMRRLKAKAKGLKAALLRIENGTYGIDERSGELISEKRLKALPTATYDIKA